MVLTNVDSHVDVQTVFYMLIKWLYEAAEMSLIRFSFVMQKVYLMHHNMHSLVKMLLRKV